MGSLITLRYLHKPLFGVVFFYKKNFYKIAGLIAIAKAKLCYAYQNLIKQDN